jgi:hypothetical protein
MRRRSLLLTIAAVMLAALYAVTIVTVMGFVAALAVPRWWPQALPSWRASVLAWTFLADFATVLFVSLPFAWVVTRFYGRAAVPAGFVIVVLVWGALVVPSMTDSLEGPEAFLRVSWLVSSLEYLATLPILVWLLQRLPSNNRSKGPDA